MYEPVRQCNWDRSGGFRHPGIAVTDAEYRASMGEGK